MVTSLVPPLMSAPKSIETFHLMKAETNDETDVKQTAAHAPVVPNFVLVILFGQFYLVNSIILDTHLFGTPLGPPKYHSVSCHKS